MTAFLLSQIIIGFAAFFDLLSFQFKERKKSLYASFLQSF